MKQLYTLLALALPALFGYGLSAQCGSLFYDGFETGTYSPTWSVGSAPITWNVSTNNPASGTYCLEGTGGASTHLLGLVTTFTPATPSSISFDIYPNGTAAGNYVVGGDASMSASNCVFFAYVTTGQLRFVSSVTYQHTATVLNQWMHVELRNINWTARTFDIYINNTLQYTAFPFRTSTQSTISRIHLYNFTAGAFARWDNITMGGVPITSFASVNNTLCNGSADGTAGVTASGGNGVYTYLWSNSATTQSVSGLTAGSYSVIVTDGIGCMDTAYATITSPSAIAITATPSDVLCNGGFSGSINASVNGGTGPYTYLWSNAAMTEDISGVGAGTYSLYVVDANSCIDSLMGITVNQPSALTTSSVNTNPVCNGDATGSSAVTATGGTPGYTYLWSPGGQTTSSVNGLTAGSYSCTITDANGCTMMESMTIVDPAAIAVLINAPDTICEGNSAVLMASGSGGTGTLNYVWQPGNLSGSTVTVSPTSTSMQYVVLTDSLGCSFTDSTLLTVRMSPAVTLGSDVQQCGGTVVLDAQNAGMIYLWNDFSTSQTLNVSVSGTYYVSVSDSFGCAGADTINVTINANPTLYLGADTTLCGGTIVLDAQIAGGTYVWSDNSNAQTLNASASGTYWVNVTDANGCSTSDTIDVTINALPTVNATASDLNVCADDADVILTGTPAGGTWSGTSVTGNQFNPSIGGGTYTPVYTYTDVNGCSNTAGVSIVVSECTGIAENNSATLINLYPNPNNGTFSLTLNSDATDVIVEVTDVDGRLIHTQTLNTVNAGSKNDITLNNAANGFYFVKVITEGNITVQRISVVR
jgi:hypothetical protein